MVRGKTSDSDKRIVVLVRGTGGTGAVKRADAEVQGFKRTVTINEDGSDPVTFHFTLGQHPPPGDRNRRTIDRQRRHLSVA